LFLLSFPIPAKQFLPSADLPSAAAPLDFSAKEKEVPCPP